MALGYTNTLIIIIIIIRMLGEHIFANFHQKREKTRMQDVSAANMRMALYATSLDYYNFFFKCTT